MVVIIFFPLSVIVSRQMPAVPLTPSSSVETDYFTRLSNFFIGTIRFI